MKADFGGRWKGGGGGGGVKIVLQFIIKIVTALV